MNHIITGIILSIIIFLSGVFIGKNQFSTHEIKIQEKIVYSTEWKTKIKVIKDPDTGRPAPLFDQDNFNRLLSCYESPLKFQEKIRNNYLYITAYDNCKEAQAEYEIVTKGNWKIYLAMAGIGVAIGGGVALYLRR